MTRDLKPNTCGVIGIPEEVWHINSYRRPASKGYSVYDIDRLIYIVSLAASAKGTPEETFPWNSKCCEGEMLTSSIKMCKWVNPQKQMKAFVWLQCYQCIGPSMPNQHRLDKKYRGQPLRVGNRGAATLL